MGFAEASRGGFWQWNTPLPYLYCGIAIIVAIIATSLLFLLCSYKDNDPAAEVLSDSATADDREEDGAEKKKKKKNQEMEIRVLDPEPKVVVVFGGDGRPLYVARPQSSSNNNNKQQYFCDQV